MYTLYLQLCTLVMVQWALSCMYKLTSKECVNFKGDPKKPHGFRWADKQKLAQFKRKREGRKEGRKEGGSYHHKKSVSYFFPGKKKT